MTTGRAVWMGLGIALVALVAAACGREAPAPAPAAADPVEARHGATPPLVLEVTGPEAVQAGETIVLRLELRRAGPSAPIALQVDVPDGVAVVEGSVVETIGDDGALVVRRTLRLAVTGVPAGDVRVTASSGGPGWGVRAEGVYRFGRAAQGAPVVRRGDEVVLPGGRGLGAPVVVE